MAVAEGRGLLRIAEAAEWLSLSRSKVYELVQRGQLEVIHIDGAVRVPSSALETYVGRLRGEQQPEQHSGPVGSGR